MEKTTPQIIAEEITARLAAGLTPDHDTMHYFLSCEGLSGAPEIISFLNNREFDSSPVYELVFYPDSAMRLKIEPLIPAHGLSSDEIKSTIASVESDITDISINISNEKVRLPRDAFRSNVILYIKRLNLEVNTDIFPRKNGYAFLQERVILRTARLSPSGEQAGFLGALADRGRSQGLRDFTGLFTFAVQITGGDDKILSQLEFRKGLYESAIRENAEFNRIISKYSMEFVMAKKIPVPLTGIEEALESIKKIDLITQLVYDITIPPMDQGVEMLLKDGKLTDIH